MNDNLKLLLHLAKSETGSIPASELNKEFKHANIQVLKYSPYFEVVQIDNIDVLRLKLEGYALANTIFTNNSVRFYNKASFVISIIALASSIAAVVISVIAL